MNIASPEMPRVSVSVVTYNHSEFIVECLDSIKAQNYPNLEVIVSDDCSTDGTGDVIADYDRKNPGFITHFQRQPVNIGISKNCNYGLSRATGDYVVPFSGDDIMLPGKIHTQLKALQEAPEAVMCFSNMEWFMSESNRKICNHFGLLQRPSTDIKRIISDFSIPTPTMMIRWDKARMLRYDESIKYINDMLFVIDMMTKGSLVYVPKVLVRYRKHKQAVTLKNYFYEDRVKLRPLLEERLPQTALPGLKRFDNLVRYAEIMTLLQKGQKKMAFGKIFAIVPAAFSSPKWMVRFGAIMFKFVR